MSKSHEEAQSLATRSHDASYRWVFLALLVLTIGEYLFARFSHTDFRMLVVGLVILAAVKASLVALFFMHLKTEGRWKYALLFPIGLLAACLVLGIYFDLGNLRATG